MEGRGGKRRGWRIWRKEGKLRRKGELKGGQRKGTEGRNERGKRERRRVICWLRRGKW